MRNRKICRNVFKNLKSVHQPPEIFRKFVIISCNICGNELEYDLSDDILCITLEQSTVEHAKFVTFWVQRLNRELMDL